MIRLVLFTLLSCVILRAEPPPRYEFLIVVDSSQSMLTRKPAAIKTVRELVRSGFGGQAAESDPYDVWTFSTELRAAAFPPQSWVPARSNLLAEVPAQFLATEKFQGRTRFRNVSEQLNLWITTQTNALLFLVTDGEDPVLGLPFDLEINEEIAKERRSVRGAKKVFLVSTMVQNGRATDWRVQVGDGELNLPQLPLREFETPVVASASPAFSDQTAAPKPEPEPEPLIVLDLPPGAKVTPLSVAPPAVEAPTVEPPVQAAAELAVVENPVVAEPIESPPEPAERATENVPPRPVAAVAPVKPEADVELPGQPKADPKMVAEAKPIIAGEDPAPTVTAVPVSVVTPATRKPLYFAAGGGLALLVLGYVLFRRKPKDSEASLISKSLNQP